MSHTCLDLSNVFCNGWLVGFIEGEGTFSLFHDSCKARTLRPSFSIAQTKSTILHTLKDTIGLGHVSKTKIEIQSIEGFEKIIQLCNGNLKLPYRQQQFEKWLDIFNKNCIGKTSFIEYKMPRNPFLKTEWDRGWITGFSEAEGCFTIRKDGFPVFNVTNNDKVSLKIIKRFFGGGSIIPHGNGRAWRYQVMHDWNTLNKVKSLFEGNLKVDKKQKKFNRWIRLFDYNDPIRVQGREHERQRNMIPNILRSTINHVIRESVELCLETA